MGEEVVLTWVTEMAFSFPCGETAVLFRDERLRVTGMTERGSCLLAALGALGAIKREEEGENLWQLRGGIFDASRGIF